MIEPRLPKKKLTQSQKSIHAKYLFGKSLKITPGWMSAKLWVNGIYVSRAVIQRNAKILRQMMENEKT